MIDGNQIEARKGEVCLPTSTGSKFTSIELREPIKPLMDCPFLESDTSAKIFNKVKMDLVAAEFYSNWWLVVMI